MTVTITPDIAGRLTIPATPELLRDWTGPVEMRGLNERRPDEWTLTAYGPGGMANGTFPSRLRLPLSRPEVRDRVVRAGAEGVRCPECPDGDCTGTGWYRRPADLSAFRDGSNLAAPGWTSAELSAALLWLSWVRLAGGMGPVVGLYSAAEDTYQGMYVRRHRIVGVGERGYALIDPDGTLTAIVPDGTEVPR